MGIDDRVVQIVRNWANMSSDPQSNDGLQALWAGSNPPGPFADAAQQLANLINDAFGTDIRATDLNPAGSIKTVNDLKRAITQ
jgi:hypothetical protein